MKSYSTRDISPLESERRQKMLVIINVVQHCPGNPNQCSKANKIISFSFSVDTYIHRKYIGRENY